MPHTETLTDLELKLVQFARTYPSDMLVLLSRDLDQIEALNDEIGEARLELDRGHEGEIARSTIIMDAEIMAHIDDCITELAKGYGKIHIEHERLAREARASRLAQAAE